MTVESVLTSLGAPPWRTPDVVEALRSDGVKRIGPHVQHALLMNVGIDVLSAVQEAGIELDQGDGEPVC